MRLIASQKRADEIFEFDGFVICTVYISLFRAKYIVEELDVLKDIFNYLEIILIAKDFYTFIT